MDQDLCHEPYPEKSLDVYKKCTKSHNNVIYELCLCLIGMVNTSIITLVFTRKKMRSSSMNILIAGLELSNFISMLTILPKYFIWATCPNIVAGTTFSVLTEAAFTLYKPSITFANWVMPVIGVWRFVAVTWPIKAHLILTKKRAVVTIILIAFGSTLLSVYIFLYHSIERSPFTILDSHTRTCFLLPNFNDTVQAFQGLNSNFFDRRVFLSLSVTFSVIPCVLSNLVNIFLICGLVAKSLNKRTLTEGQHYPFSIGSEARTTCVLVLFLFAHDVCYVCPDLFTLIVYLCSDCQIERTDYFCFFFYHFPAVIYLSFLSFICYCIMSARFRKTIWELFKFDEFWKKIQISEFVRGNSKKFLISRNNGVIEETRF